MSAPCGRVLVAELTDEFLVSVAKHFLCLIFSGVYCYWVLWTLDGSQVRAFVVCCGVVMFSGCVNSVCRNICRRAMVNLCVCVPELSALLSNKYDDNN